MGWNDLTSATVQYLNIVIIDQITEAANISVVCGVSSIH